MKICGDKWHLECLKEAIQNQVNEKKFPNICPNYECKQVLPDWELRAIFADQPATMRKLLDFRLNWTVMKEMDLENCPSPDCDFIYVKPNLNGEENKEGDSFRQQYIVQDLQDPSNFKCPRCEKHLCLLCNTKPHIG